MSRRDCHRTQETQVSVDQVPYSVSCSDFDNVIVLVIVSLLFLTLHKTSYDEIDQNFFLVCTVHAFDQEGQVVV